MADETIAEHRTYGDQPMAVRGGMLCKNITVKQCIEFNSTHSSSTSAIKVVSGTTTVSRLISATVTPTTVDDFILVDVTHATGGKRALYVTSTMTATTGDNTAGRFRAESAGATKTSGETYGVHAQGIVNAGLRGATVNALYAEAIAKGTSTVTTIRGAMIACDSEATPTSIGTMLGAEIRAKTSVDPSTAYENLRITAEKFGAGYALDAHITIGSVTWGTAEVAADAGIEFTSTAIITSLIETTTPCTSVIKFATDTGEGFETGSLKDSDSADIKCDAYIKYMVATTPYYGALYNTTN